tara:strand:- start:3255 stop:3782 length:528 start_codon:yes stop_codon:yes gene_type:complete
MTLIPGKKLAIRRQKQGTTFDSPFEKSQYYKSFFKDDKDRLPYAGEEKLEGVMKKLGIKWLSESAEWKRFQKELVTGKEKTWVGPHYIPERPEVAKKRLAREVRNEQKIAENENRPAILFQSSTSDYYDQDKALYETFRKDLSTKASKLDHHLQSEDYDMEYLKDLFREYTDAKR